MKKLLLILLCVPLIGLGQCVSGDCKNGKGTYKLSSGDKYVGEWVDGQFEGQGTYTWDNGDKYVGDWIEGEQNGYGVMTNVLSNKEKKDKKRYYFIKYKGHWEDGKRHGHGTAYFSNGSEWTGEWIENEQAEVEKKNDENTYNSDDIVGDNNYTVITLEELKPNHFYLKLNVDGVFKDFVFDTGASQLVFDQDFLKKLKNNGCDVKKTNLKGEEARTASGEIVKFKVVHLNNVKIGDYVLNNVVASVGPKGTSPLCGIGFFNKFSNVKWNMKDGNLKLYK